jgi:hypothetical protein
MIQKCPGRIHLQHIMWQPTFNCPQKCKGCYINQSPAAQYTFPISDQILKLIYEDDKVRCDQLTIALDSFHSPPQFLIDALKKVWTAHREEKLPFPPELCVNVYSWNMALCWARAMGLSDLDFLKPLTMLSLSTLPVQGKQCSALHELCHSASVTLNYNHTVTKQDLDSKSFEMGVRYADHVHLVLHKNTLGSSHSDESWESWFKARKLVQKWAPEKLKVDTCITESLRFVATKKSCGAGITKVHIWPDNSVTGCPYDALHLTTSNDYGKQQVTYDVLEELEKIVNGQCGLSIGFCNIPAEIGYLCWTAKTCRDSQVSENDLLQQNKTSCTMMNASLRQEQCRSLL